MKMFWKTLRDLSNIRTSATLANSDTASQNELLASCCNNPRKDVSFLLPSTDVRTSYTQIEKTFS